MADFLGKPLLAMKMGGILQVFAQRGGD